MVAPHLNFHEVNFQCSFQRKIPAILTAKLQKRNKAQILKFINSEASLPLLIIQVVQKILAQAWEMTRFREKMGSYASQSDRHFHVMTSHVKKLTHSLVWLCHSKYLSLPLIVADGKVLEAREIQMRTSELGLMARRAARALRCAWAWAQRAMVRNDVLFSKMCNVGQCQHDL